MDYKKEGRTIQNIYFMQQFLKEDTYNVLIFRIKSVYLNGP